LSCTSLTNITVDPLNSTFSSVDGVLFNRSQTTLVQYPSGKLGGYTIPNGVTKIGDDAFGGCSGLTSVTVPNSVTSIEDYAFNQCSSLTDITLGMGITSIGRSAFGGCSGLTNVTIPNSVSSIGESAFAGTRLTSVTIPNSVTNIGGGAFWLCTNLTSVSIGSGVNSIGDSAFADCTGLTSVTLGSGVTSIGASAFAVTGLTSVTIPNSVTNIGGIAFYGCASLTNITVDPLNSAYSSVGGVLFNNSQTTLVQYPGGNVGRYTIPNRVTNIGDEAFAWSGLTSVTVGSSVTTIGDSAFAVCSGLTSVYFLGDAPILLGGADVFSGGGVYNENPTIYYLPGTTGWGSTFGGIPTALWALPYPLILQASLGVQTNGFGFTVSWATNLPVVVETCTDLANPIWSPLATNALSAGWFHFSDPRWMDYPNRFYRVRSK
jgi:hypothetical protein